MRKNKKKKIDKSVFKMTSEQLQTWLHYRKACSSIENRKGKGSYKRKSIYLDRSE